MRLGAAAVCCYCVLLLCAGTPCCCTWHDHDRTYRFRCGPGAVAPAVTRCDGGTIRSGTGRDQVPDARGTITTEPTPIRLLARWDGGRARAPTRAHGLVHLPMRLLALVGTVPHSTASRAQAALSAAHHTQHRGAKPGLEPSRTSDPITQCRRRKRRRDPYSSPCCSPAPRHSAPSRGRTSSEP